MTTFSSSSEFTESFDASFQLAQAPVTFPRLMEEQRGDVRRDNQQAWARLSSRDCRQPESKTHADMLLLASATLQPQVWLFPGHSSSIDPNVWIPGWRRISLICWRLSARWLRQSEDGVLEKGAQSGPSTASSSSSSSTAVRLQLQSCVQCPPTKTNPEQCCLPFQWPHEDSRQLFRVIFMSKVRLIQL